MNSDPGSLEPESAELIPNPRRLFLFEPGWRVGLKVGSQREFCYMMTPGQDYYHRFQDGEIFLQRGDERLCLACAERRGLLSYAPKELREPKPDQELDLDDSVDAIDLNSSSDEIDPSARG